METSAPLSFEGLPVSSFAESGEIRVLHPAQPGTTPDFQAPLVRPKTPNRNGEVPGALSVRKRSAEVGAAPIPSKKAKDLPQPMPGTSTEAGIRGTPTPDSSRQEESSSALIRALLRKPAYVVGSSGFSLGAVNPSDDADRSSKAERTSQTSVHSIALPRKPASLGGSSGFSVGAVNPSDDADRSSKEERTSQTRVHSTALPGKPTSSGGSSVSSLGAVNLSDDRGRRSTAEGNTQTGAHIRALLRKPASLGGSSGFSLGAVDPSGDPDKRLTAEGTTEMAGLLDLEALRQTFDGRRHNRNGQTFGSRSVEVPSLLSDASLATSDVLRQAGNDRSWWRELVQNIPVEVVDYKHIVTFRPQCVANIRLAKKLIPAIEQLKMGAFLLGCLAERLPKIRADTHTSLLSGEEAFFVLLSRGVHGAVFEALYMHAAPPLSLRCYADARSASYYTQ
ncbi:hypothetical protein EPH_0074870 [Eimeria praecox]|uniref:Uncharacterized protein n=1 Tax=Eimeria praecox TaxID=51316 RepID=U6H8G2_9EIME|nr:hypothetical protein EPH_0074870 [Eimeria praecox]